MATLAGCLAVASPAAAHLDLASTSPADGTVLRNPSAPITVTFTKAATPAGNGFTLYDARGREVALTVDSADGGVTWKIRPATDLEPANRYGLRWKVAAGDSHPKSGVVRFRVAGTPGTGQNASPGPDASESVPAPTPSGAHTAAGGSQAMPSGHAQMPGHTAAGSAGDHDGGGASAGLDAVLASGEEEPRFAGLAAGLGRWLSFAGILIAVGALIVIVTTLVGSTGDVRLAQQVVRIAAALAVLGALIEGACLYWSLGADAPWTPVLAVGLRLLAGAAMLLSLRLVPHGAGGRRSHDIPVLPETSGRRHSGATGDQGGDLDPGWGGSRTAQLVLPPPVRTGRVRGVPARPLATAVICAAMLVSFVFDGHTATVAPRLLIAAADLAHTAAAAVWVGGVVLLATLLLVRARAGVPTGAGELAVRFSVPATAAVVVAGLAGTALTLLVIDSPGELTGTAWGRMLLIKMGLVAVVAIMGYVNNRYALPALDSWRPATARLLRRTVAAEATVMILVLLTTAILVASQT